MELSPIRKLGVRLFIKFFGIKELEAFLQNLSVLLASGADIVHGLEAISMDTKSFEMKYIIDQLRDDLAQGMTMSDSFKRLGLFTESVRALIDVGERTGSLPGYMELISQQMEQDRSFKSKLRSAMMYPFFVIALTLVVALVIAWFILPQLANVFGTLDVELPFMTRWLISFSQLLQNHGIIFVPGLLIFIGLIIYLLFFYKKTRIVGEYILFSIPAFKKLLMELEITRTSYMIGTLLNAGFPIFNTLTILENSTSLQRYKKFYRFLRYKIQEGESFRESFVAYPKTKNLFPTIVRQIIYIGEQSGQLSGSFLKIYETYKGKVEISTKNLTVMLEPLLLIVIWVGVIGVAMAVILPIYDLVGQLNY
jgi:type II secretory pathway component PulF